MALLGHQGLSDRAAVEQDDLVLVVAVVVVPVEDCGRLFARELHCAHGECGAHVDLTGSCDAAVVQVAEEDARADAELGLHLVPAAQCQRVEVILVNILIDDDGHLRQGQLLRRGDDAEVRVLLELFHASLDGRVVVRELAELEEDLGKVEGLSVDAVFLQCQLVEADRLERGRACADAADVEALHAINDTADRREVLQVLRERGAQRMHDVGLQDRERNAVLCEDVRDGELAAERIAAVCEVHLADLIGIRLHQDRDARILKSRDRAVFVRENRHGEDDAVILAVVLLEPLRVQKALVSRLDAAEPRQLRIHRDVVIARIRHSFDHVLARAVDQLAGHETAVAECQCECHFLFAAHVYLLKNVCQLYLVFLSHHRFLLSCSYIIPSDGHYLYGILFFFL